MTVLGACLLAEGFTDFAAPGRCKVTRMVNGQQKRFKIDLVKVREGKKEDMPLQRAVIVSRCLGAASRRP